MQLGWKELKLHDTSDDKATLELFLFLNNQNKYYLEFLVKELNTYEKNQGENINLDASINQDHIFKESYVYKCLKDS